MSTTFDPSKEASLHLLAKETSTNGQAEVSLSHLAGRPEFWRKSAPKALRRQRLGADAALQTYWNERAGGPTVAELCDAEGAPLGWGLLGGSVSAATHELLKLAGSETVPAGVDKKQRRKHAQQVQQSLSQWVESARRAAPGYDLGVASLAVATLLHEHGSELSTTIAWKALDVLASLARHAPSWNLGADATAEEVAASQLLGGELPMTLAYLFGEMAPLYKLRRAASDYIAGSMQELLNGDGLPRAAHLGAMRALAACWTRCRAVSNELKGAKLPKPSWRQFDALVRQSLRWSAPSGALLLAEDSAEAWDEDFLRAVLRYSGTKKDAAAASALLTADAAQSAGAKLPEAAYDCEWAALAVMRRRWSAEEPVVAIDYSRPQMRLDVWAGGRQLIGGPITTESRLDGKPLRPTGAWENVCWFKDRDANYLELTLPLQNGARLERQILLALRDGFVLVADHLQSEEPAALEHVLQAPLGPGLLFCGEGETRDALLVDGAPVARLMPLALPEWRIDPRGGELSQSGGAVRLASQGKGRSLACPLFIDLRADRSGRQSTWRQLTVAEQLQIQPPDVAVSYRIQSGEDQWVYYRSQGPRGNRTFIGANTSSECVIARFKASSGAVVPLMEIEG